MSVLRFKINYKPTKAQLIAHKSPADVKIIFGAKGAGKTDFAMHELLTKYFFSKPYSVSVFLRKTIPELKDSLMKRFKETVDPQLYRWYEQDRKVINVYNNAEIWFRSLDDYAKLENIDIAAFWIDQAEEIDDWNFVAALLDRLRQRDIDKYRAVITAYPPPNEKHWLAKAKELIRGWSVEIWHWSVYDNRENLPPHYIPNLEAMYRNSPSLFKRYVLGQFAPVIAGEPVFGDFDELLHVIPDKYAKDVAPTVVYRGWDFGFRHPACVWVFEDAEDRIIWDYSMLGENIDIRTFARRVLAKSREMYGDVRFVDCCDPAGRAKMDTGMSAIEILEHEFGLTMNMRTDFEGRNVMRGIELIRKYLQTLVNGKPALLISRKNDLAIEGFLGGYHLNKNGDIEKDGKYDHIFDALRYVFVNFFDYEHFDEEDLEMFEEHNASLEGYIV